MHQNVLQLIGNTPMVQLNNITKGLSSKILVKLEYLNPSGSIKDRIALEMIEKAEQNKDLQPGYTIVEASTGNTGIAITFVGTLKGYKVIIYQAVSGKMSTERTQIMKNLGAEVRIVTTPQFSETGSAPGAEIEIPARKACLELEKNNSNVWWARQFSNPSNVTAHNKTGKEILEQVPDITCFTASIGTGGTLLGIAEVLKKENPDTKIIGIQPASSSHCLIPGDVLPKTDIDGGIVSDMLKQKGLIDEIVTVSDRKAIDMAHKLWKKEGLHAGISSGANVLVALREAKTTQGTVVTILPDSMDRYLTDEHYIT
ncbi:MAG: cysteine synthase family protein [Candidatus Methanofastidiosia archaeon]|jgi:cysteine synthase A